MNNNIIQHLYFNCIFILMILGETVKFVWTCLLSFDKAFWVWTVLFVLYACVVYMKIKEMQYIQFIQIN